GCPRMATPPSWAGGQTTAKRVRLGGSAAVGGDGGSKAGSSSAPAPWEAQTRDGQSRSPPTATLLSWVDLATIYGIHRCPSALAALGRHGYLLGMAAAGRRKARSS